MIFLLFSIANLIHLSNPTSILDNSIYKKYNSYLQSPPCVRLTNATHQTGCSTGDWPNVGTLVSVSQQSDIERILKHDLYSPYIALMTEKFFTNELIIKLYSSGSVGGIILDTLSDQNASSFSPDSKCPNKNPADDVNSCNWNPFGNSLSLQNFEDFAIFAVIDSTLLHDLKQCANYNDRYASAAYHCSVQLTSRMFSAVSTSVCLRRESYVLPQLTSPSSFCTILQGWNIWGSMLPLEQKVYNSLENGVVMITAKLDSTAFFHDMSYGAENDVSGIITVLAAAEVLGYLKRSNIITDTKYPLIFAFFDGESWDHIGSSRMAYDMNQGTFPIIYNTSISLSGIRQIVAIEQVALAEQNTWYLHLSTGSNGQSHLEQEIIKSFNESSSISGVNIVPIKSQKRTLSSTTSMFTQHLKNITTAVLTDFKDNFSTPFYGSRLDNAISIGYLGRKKSSLISKLTNLCTSLVHLSLNLSQTKFNSQSNINLTCSSSIISDLLNCFIANSNCSLFQEVSSTGLDFSDISGPVSRYVGVQSSSNINLGPLMVHNFLSYFTGSHWKTGSSNCTDNLSSTSTSLYRTYYANGPSRNATLGNNGICVNSTVYYYKALSPASEDNYVDSIYSTWAESIWEADSLSIWVFLVSSNYVQYGEFILGVLMTCFTIVLSALITIKHKQIFKNKA